MGSVLVNSRDYFPGVSILVVGQVATVVRAHQTWLNSCKDAGKHTFDVAVVAATLSAATGSQPAALVMLQFVPNRDEGPVFQGAGQRIVQDLALYLARACNQTVVRMTWGDMVTVLSTSLDHQPE